MPKISLLGRDRKRLEGVYMREKSTKKEGDETDEASGSFAWDLLYTASTDDY